ncbi:hypothetical protein TanjilG_25672 [Lupinus angustifolius]|uniref:Uncharacterized protein n=1 Tax=Lupinus angustifolius TaxID=3871 RepID=A0A1J7H9G7_LUPAN|nr:hypothetical protein TanjilG_25672 [Lupinus angustifolius]
MKMDTSSPGQLSSQEERISYREKLLNFSMVVEDIPMEEEDEDLVENQWYHKEKKEGEFNMCPQILVSKEEFWL